MKLAALFSGGKDSAYALYVVQQMGRDVGHLVSVFPRKDSQMFHYPNIRLTEHMSKALGLPHVSVESGEGEEEELGALRAVLGGLADTADLDGVVTGAIASDYQWSRINGVCEELGLKTFSPLWRRDCVMLLEDIIGAGFEVVVVGVSAEGLDSSWLGRKLNREALDDLLRLSEERGINVSGEGGEYETLVLDGPNFSKRLCLDETRVDWNRDSGTMSVAKASLAEKSPGR